MSGGLQTRNGFDHRGEHVRTSRQARPWHLDRFAGRRLGVEQAAVRSPAADGENGLQALDPPGGRRIGLGLAVEDDRILDPRHDRGRATKQDSCASELGVRHLRAAKLHVHGHGAETQNIGVVHRQHPLGAAGDALVKVARHGLDVVGERPEQGQERRGDAAAQGLVMHEAAHPRPLLLGPVKAACFAHE